MRYSELQESIKRCLTQVEFNTLLNKHCTLSRNTILYRGVISSSEFKYYSEHYPPNIKIDCAMGFGEIRQNRQTRASTIQETKLFNELMEFNGWPFRKENTLSLTVEHDQTSGYGVPHKIYPYDGSKYLYSTRIRDLLSIPYEVTNFSREEVLQKTFTSVGYDPTKPMVTEKGYANFMAGIDGQSLKVTDDPTTIKYAKGEVLVLGTYYLSKKI